jgi:hypothetical protein
MKHEPIAAIALAALVDELAQLKAQVAPLEDRMEQIKDYLKAADVPCDEKTGTKRINGTEHTAVIKSVTSDRPATDLLKLHFGEEVFRDQWCYKSVAVSCNLTGRKTR